MERSQPDPNRRSHRVRLKAAPVFLAVLSSLLFLLSFPLPDTDLWQGFLIAIPVLVIATGLGWRAAAKVAPMGLALLWLRSYATGVPADVLDYGGFVLAMVLGTLAGDTIFRLWRSSERRARHSERRARLLQHAAVELNQSSSEADLFRNAPRLLSDILPFTHAEVFVPEGDHLRVHTTWRWKVEPDFTIPYETVTGRAYVTGKKQYVPDTTVDADYMVAPGADPTLSELALPIVVDGAVRAVLNLEHDTLDAFAGDVQPALEAFVRMIEEVLYRLDASAALERNKAEQKTLADLSQRLLMTDDVGDAAGAALEVLLPALDVDCGAFLMLKHGHLSPLAVRGDFTFELERRLFEGLPLTGSLADVWEKREPVFVDDIQHPVWTASADARSVALLPIVDTAGQMQSLLALTRLRSVRPWTDEQQRMLLAAAPPLSAALERATLNRQLLAMLEVIRQLSSSEAPNVLYNRAAEATLDLVPGAEAVSILVRHSDLFYYEAAIGWDLEELQDNAGPFTYQEQLEWYAGDPERFEQGIARVLKGGSIADHSGTAERTPMNIKNARVTEMRSQVMIPISDASGIVAILNIDNFSTEDAFSTSALRLAEAFAQHIAVVVRQAEQMVELERSAVTDALTGLGNREGFERMARQELARARRYEHHLNLVMIDLDNFKQFNDRFGHAVGDDVLVQVADVLKRAKRSTDSVFRWGGDEFVLMLPEVRPEAAHVAMERLASLVSQIEVQGIKLGASVGLASYPNDGLDHEALMKRADGRMYDWKSTRSRSERRSPKSLAS